MIYCHGSSPKYIRMWYQYITIHSATHGIYVHPYYFFVPEANYSKGLSSENDTNTTKQDLPEKYSTILSERVNNIYTALRNKKTSPKEYDIQKFIVCNHYPSVYEYIYSLIISSDPNNLNRPIYLIAAPPTQLETGYPLSNFPTGTKII